MTDTSPACEARSDLEVDLEDLAELALPFMDEPSHPILQQYTRLITSKVDS